MKAPSILRSALTLFAGLMATIQVSNALATNIETTEMVFYKNEWLPVYNLEPVECTAEKTEGQLMEARIVNGKVMPYLELAAVTIRPDGNYSPEEVRPVRLKSTLPAGQRMAVVKVNGIYMPYMELDAVAVTAEGADADHLAIEEAAKHSGAEGRVFTISARKTFDSLINLLVNREGNALFSVVFP